MRKKFKILLVSLIIFGLMINIITPYKLDQYIYLNITPSLPRGLYLVKSKVPEIGDLVVIDLPNDTRMLLAQQGIEVNGLLLKPIIAVAGDYVCNHDNFIINQNKIKLLRVNTINLYPICRELTNQEYFVAVIDRDNSLDSRYFGSVTAQDLKAVAHPLLVF